MAQNGGARPGAGRKPGSTNRPQLRSFFTEEQPEEKSEAEQPKEGEDKAPEGEQPKDEPETKPEPKLSKKRSIYEELKDERAKRQELEQENARLKGEEAPNDEPSKPEPEKPTDELEAYADENGLDAKQLGRLVEIMAKRLPNSQLSDDDKQALSQLKDWRAQQARTEEDRSIMDTASAVKKDLGDDVVTNGYKGRFGDFSVFVSGRRNTRSRLLRLKPANIGEFYRCYHHRN